MENSKVWFITGASKGLGLLLTKQLLQEGEKVVATIRNVKALSKKIGSKYTSSFLPLEVDLTNEQSIKNSIASTINNFG